MLFQMAMQNGLRIINSGAAHPLGGCVESDVDALRYAIEFCHKATQLYFPYPAHCLLDENLFWKQRPEVLGEAFYLPVSPLAVEDPANVVVLCDLHENQRGVSTDRVFVQLDHQGADGVTSFQHHFALDHALDLDLRAAPQGVHLMLGIVSGLTVLKDGEFFRAANITPLMHVLYSREAILKIDIFTPEFFADGKSIHLDGPCKFVRPEAATFNPTKASDVVANIAATCALIGLAKHEQII